MFVPFVIATIALILIQRRTRQRGEDLPLSAAIGTGVILGFVTINVALVVVTAVTGQATSVGKISGSEAGSAILAAWTASPSSAASGRSGSGSG